MGCDAKIVRLSLELGLAVNDYNAGLVDKLDDVIKTTLEYLAEVKDAYSKGMIKEEELGELFALVGQSWASVHGFHRNRSDKQSESK
jgi:hypothetical protein